MTIIKIVGIGLLVMVTASLAGTVTAQPGVDDRGKVFTYSIKPGTSEWASLQTHAEMVETCRIPEATLKSIPTERLIQACLDYPLFGDMFAFNTLQQGFERVASRFNGLQELLKRDDSGAGLLRYFKEMDPGDDSRKSFDFEYVELLLAQDAVLATLPPGDRVALLGESYGKFREKQRYPGKYGSLSQTADLFLMARVMNALRVPSFKEELSRDDRLEEFCRRSAPLDRDLFRKVVTHVERFITDNKQGVSHAN